LKISSIKKWLAIIGLAALIPIILSLALGVPLIQALVAAGLTVLLVLSGFFFRLFGRDRKISDYQNP
jgi:Sec-independent protein secretion pathway component TatC